MGYNSTAKMFSDFIESDVWGDIRAELGIWLGEVRDQLENLQTDDPKALYRLQGNAEAIRNMLNLPEQVLNNILDDMRLEKGV